MGEKKKSLELGPKDAAIVLRSDGSLEASIPELDGDELVPENIFTGAAVMFALQNPQLCDLIHDYFMEECSQLVLKPANDL